MSMRIDTILESTLRNSKLKRVRIKIDPAQYVMQDYHMLDAYEGYVLEENLDTLKVYMLNLPDGFDPVQVVKKQHAQEISNEDRSQIVTKVLKQLDAEGISCDNPQYQKIKNLNDGEFVDAYLRELGFDDKKLIEFYKKMANQPVYEGIASTLSSAKDALANTIAKTGEGAKKMTSSGLFKAGEAGAKALASIPGLLVGKNNIIGRFARFMQTFDVNELIKSSKEYDSKDTSKIQVGKQVFIRGLTDKLQHHHIDAPSMKVEGGYYQINGVIKERVFTETAKSYDILVVHPDALNRYYNFKFSYPEIYNPSRRGILVLEPRDQTADSESYLAIMKVYLKYVLISIIPKEDESLEKPFDKKDPVYDISKISLDQDKIRLNVDKALKEFLQGRELENIGQISNTISANILRMGESKGIKIFDETMFAIVQDKKAQVGNPEKQLRKYLGPVGLLPK